MRFIKLLLAALVAVFAFSALTACATAEKLDMSSYSMVIDVRTPAEVATGYLEGAVNFDFQGAEFQAQVAELDPAANYYIYCRSGNRAGKAIDFLKSAGFTGTLTNGGSVESAAAETGLPIVTN